MGYAFYEIPHPVTGRMMQRGYGVRCKCHKRGCVEQIDRGLSYLCYHCTWYFCGEHLTSVYDDRDEIIEAECFAGTESQVCERCAKELEQEFGASAAFVGRAAVENSSS